MKEEPEDEYRYSTSHQNWVDEEIQEPDEAKYDPWYHNEISRDEIEGFGYDKEQNDEQNVQKTAKDNSEEPDEKFHQYAEYSQLWTEDQNELNNKKQAWVEDNLEGIFDFEQ